jgi:energy-coupling factor transport system permease protein
LTTNPLVLVLLVAAALAVALTRRGDDPWARSVRAYLWLAGIVLAVRLGMQVVLGGRRDGTVLVTLPEAPLPAWAAGIRLGGPVTAEALAATTYDGLRLVALLVCVGAANALANPRRALRSVPPALAELSLAVVVALTVAPQIVESTMRVRRARRLRGSARTVRAIVVPVLADALDRSLALAASMDVRGYGRSRGTTGAWPWLAIAGSMAATVGLYGLLGLPDSARWSAPMLVLGLGMVVIALAASGRRRGTTRYRPDTWAGRETVVAAAGAAAAGILAALAAGGASVLHPSTEPLVWPSLDPTTGAGASLLLVVALAACPLVVVPGRSS